jgi:hypothetical protein
MSICSDWTAAAGAERENGFCFLAGTSYDASALRAPDNSNPEIVRDLSGISQTSRGETLIILGELFLQSSTGELDDERTDQRT